MTGKPMIENSDRGITLNKSLAWTLAAALGTGGMWVGTTVAELRSEVRSLHNDSAQRGASRAEHERRIRILEENITRYDERTLNIANTMMRIDTRLERLEQALVPAITNGGSR